MVWQEADLLISSTGFQFSENFFKCSKNFFVGFEKLFEQIKKTRKFWRTEK